MRMAHFRQGGSFGVASGVGGVAVAGVPGLDDGPLQFGQAFGVGRRRAPHAGLVERGAGRFHPSSRSLDRQRRPRLDQFSPFGFRGIPGRGELEGPWVGLAGGGGGPFDRAQFAFEARHQLPAARCLLGPADGIGKLRFDFGEPPFEVGEAHRRIGACALLARPLPLDDLAPLDHPAVAGLHRSAVRLGEIGVAHDERFRRGQERGGKVVERQAPPGDVDRAGNARRPRSGQRARDPFRETFGRPEPRDQRDTGREANHAHRPVARPQLDEPHPRGVVTSHPCRALPTLQAWPVEP